MFKFVYPIVLVVLVLAVVLLALFIFFEFRRTKQMKAFGNIKLLSTLMPTRSLLRQRLKFGLCWVALVALVLAVARIQMAGNSSDPIRNLNVEMVAVVDVSNSMLCEDETPSRLERAKMVLNAFLESSDNLKLGLVEFAGTAVTRMPLTADKGSAKLFVNSMATTDISAQGTAIGAAMRQAQRCFSNTEGVVRCMLLITDAENHEDDAISTAEVVNREGKMLVNVVGIGTAEGGNIMLADTTLNDAEGKPVVTKFNEKMAQDIAKAGKGIYLTAASPNEVVDKVMAQMSKIASSTSQTSTTASITYVDKFELFAWIAFILLLIDAVLMERRNHLMDRLKQFFGKKNVAE